VRRGRKPKPTVLKLLAGSRADRINPAEPVPGLVAPEPPDHLDRAALDEWKRLTPILMEMGILSKADGAALALYCDAYSRWLRARMDVLKRGSIVETAAGTLKLNPHIYLINSSMRLMKELLVEFGCTPSARSRVSVVMVKRDELSEFLGRKKS
jgi:P27 family predicted phage terminase small subunit